MPYRDIMPVPHGPTCDCGVCLGKRVANQERINSTDRLAWLERKLLSMEETIQEIKKGNNSMGYALWCQPGGHSFDENDKGAKRVTTDEYDEKTNVKREVTIHICSRHVAGLFDPRPKSLREIHQEIEEATEIGDDSSDW